MKHLISKERTFSHSINQVWKAISNGEEISTWFLNADFKPEAGYKYTFKSEGDKCTTITGEVKKADPYTLIYTWIVEGTNIETTVTWTLEDLGGSTKLLLEHSDISNYHGPTAVEMMGHFNAGWENCLIGLTAYLTEMSHAG